MIGRQIGSYRVVAPLGRGGMGAVFRAEHVTLGRVAAAKVLLPEMSRDREMVQRFFNEARATANLRHPGVVDVFDFGYLDDGRGWLLMELLEGESLAARLQRGPLGGAEAAAIVRQTAAALDAAHARGIVHRDIKPQNLFLSGGAGGALRVKVLDFGIAKLRPEGDAPVPETASGAVLGTPYYMSPEQCRGARDIDARSDVYALGCVLFEMLTGQRPFSGGSTVEVMAAHLHVPPPPARAVRAELSPAVEEVLARALDKDVGARTSGVVELADQLDSALAGRALPPRAAPPRASDAGTATRRERPARVVATAPAPRRRRALLVAVGVLGAAALAAVATRSRWSPRPQRPASAAAVRDAAPDAPAPVPAPVLAVREADAAPAPAPRDAAIAAATPSPRARPRPQATPVPLGPRRIEPAEKDAGMRAGRSRFKLCTRAAEGRGVKLPQDMVLRIDIDTDGAVYGVKAERSSGEAALDACIMGVVQTLKFAQTFSYNHFPYTLGLR